VPASSSGAARFAISGWHGTPYDLRAHATTGDEGEAVRTFVSAEVAATLGSLVLVDSAGERSIFRATPAADGIVVEIVEGVVQPSRVAAGDLS